MNEIVTLITIYAATVVIVTLTGCSYLNGPKEVIKMADGTEITRYITGVDFGLSLSGTDELENRRGIKPTK